MLRFVVGPEDLLVPDFGSALSGRGLWLSPRRGILEQALKRGGFDRAARRKLRIPDRLAELVETGLVRRCIEAIGLARRGGYALSGFEKVSGELRKGISGVLLAARDGAQGGRGKIAALAPEMPVVTALSAAELGAAFGREHVVHALVTAGKLAERLVSDGGRLEEFRGTEAEGPATTARNAGRSGQRRTSQTTNVDRRT